MDKTKVTEVEKADPVPGLDIKIPPTPIKPPERPVANSEPEKINLNTTRSNIK